MAYTFLQLKNATANQLGRSDGGTANTVRDNHINDVIRSEIADVYPFSWLRRTNSAISLDSSGQSDLPSDYNPTHGLYDLRKVFTGAGGDNIFTPVPREAFDSFGAGSYRYYIDYNTSTDLYRLNTTEVSVTVQIVYYLRPAALSGDTDISPVPDQDLVAFLAAARYYLSSQGDETNHDRFKALGNQRLQQMIQNDKKSNPLRPKRGAAWGANLGWNVR